MGIRMQRNTWGTPLLLINSWLPTPPATTSRPSLIAVAQRFARAGWLGRATGSHSWAVSSSQGSVTPAGPSQLCVPRATAVRVVRTAACADGSPKGDSRVVLSGRMADVCAELERLAAMEPGQATATH